MRSQSFAATVAPREVSITPLEGGGWSLRSPQALGFYPRCVGEVLEHWARTEPDRVFLADRASDGPWRSVSYADAASKVRAIAQGLLELGLSPDRPVLTLSRNSIEHGLMILGAMHAGLSVVPVAPAYAMASKDLRKLQHVFDLIDPSLVYVDEGHLYAEALGRVAREPVRVVSSGSPVDGHATIPFADLVRTPVGQRLRHAFAAITPDTIGKVLLTSGSTAMPKGVINTHRMMCANMQAVSQVYHFYSESPPIQLSWLPWNHTAGGNHVFHTTLWHGGSLYIDDGKPVPGQVERTVANLRDIPEPVTVYLSVPLGYSMLLPYLESDAGLRRQFLSKIRYMGSAGAGFPRNQWERIQELVEHEQGHRILFATNWGATETAPTATAVHFDSDRPNNIGLPIPGVELRLAPLDGKYELRVKGPSIFPGYWKQPELTAASRDQDGFYRTGDAGKFIDPDHPELGVQFDGRVAEDFKLLSGTWVSVGNLRVRAVQAGSPVVQDVVVTGHNRDEIGLLVFPNVPACRALCPELPAEATAADVIASEAVRRHLQGALGAMARESSGSSTRPARAWLLAEPPRPEHNEITEKGYINQRAVLENRAADVERLYSDDPMVIHATRHA